MHEHQLNLVLEPVVDGPKTPIHQPERVMFSLTDDVLLVSPIPPPKNRYVRNPKLESLFDNYEKRIRVLDELQSVYKENADYRSEKLKWVGLE